MAPFSKQLEETLRENKSHINQSIREIERSRRQYELEEKDLTNKIKQYASKGNMASVKLLAKDLVRVRNSIQKCFQMRSQMQAMNLRVQTLKSTASISDSMKDVSKTLSKVNDVLELPKMQGRMKEFVKESMKLEASQERMEETLDSVFEADEELEDKIVSQTLESIGIDLNKQLVNNEALPDLNAVDDKESVADSFDYRMQNLRK